MLQNIRDKSQGLVASLVVGLLIATFALWGIHSYVTGSKNAGLAAKVNGLSITSNDVNASYERLRQQQQLQLGADFSLNQTAELQLKKQALQQLIVSNVLITAANKADYRVTLDQVNEALLHIPAFQENGQFSVNRFHEILNSILYSQNQFLIDMRESMLINQVQGGYVNSAFALPNDVATAVRLVNQKRDISYAIIPSARFATSVKASPDETKNYYQTHQNQFQSPEQVSIQYLELSLPALKSGLHFDQTKLQQYYETNLQNYTRPTSWHVAQILIRVPQHATAADVNTAKEKVNAILAKLKSGSSFADLAKQYSDDSVTSVNGGEMPWFSAGTLDPQFEKAVASLQKEGDISLPVKTAAGFSIIELLGEKKAQVLPFIEVKDQVANALAEQQAELMFADASDKLSNLTYSNPDSLDVAAKALGLPIQTTDLFGHEGAKTGIAANPHVVSASFSNDVLQQNNNSDVIQLDPNTVVVLRIKQHIPASVLPYADVQNTIQSQLIKDKALQQAELLGQEVLQRLQHQEAPDVLAKSYDLSWHVENNLARYDSRIDSAILSQAFQLPHPSPKSPSAQGLQLASGDYAVVMVNAVHNGELSPDNIQKRVFSEEIEKNFGDIDYELYVRDLMKQAHIKINPHAFTDDSDSTSDAP